MVSAPSCFQFYSREVLLGALEEFPLGWRNLYTSHRAMVLIGISLWSIHGRRRQSRRSIERIKPAASHLSHDPLEAHTHEESTEAPE